MVGGSGYYQPKEGKHWLTFFSRVDNIHYHPPVHVICILLYQTLLPQGNIKHAKYFQLLISFSTSCQFKTVFSINKFFDLKNQKNIQIIIRQHCKLVFPDATFVLDKSFVRDMYFKASWTFMIFCFSTTFYECCITLLGKPVNSKTTAGTVFTKTLLSGSSLS